MFIIDFNIFYFFDIACPKKYPKINKKALSTISVVFMPINIDINKHAEIIINRRAPIILIPKCVVFF